MTRRSALFYLHACRAPHLVGDRVLCRAVLARHIRSSGRVWLYLTAQGE